MLEIDGKQYYKYGQFKEKELRTWCIVCDLYDCEYGHELCREYSCRFFTDVNLSSSEFKLIFKTKSLQKVYKYIDKVRGGHEAHKVDIEINNIVPQPKLFNIFSWTGADNKSDLCFSVNINDFYDFYLHFTGDKEKLFHKDYPLNNLVMCNEYSAKQIIKALKSPNITFYVYYFEEHLFLIYQ